MTFRCLLTRAAAVGMLLLVFVQFGFAQGRTVTGKITDGRDGSPITAASIAVKGTNRGTTTDAAGAFRISVNNEDVLVITSVGFTRQEVSVGAQTDITVSMAPSSTANLNEVVVVGYGTQRKRDLTGAVATVTSKDFVKGAIQTPEQLIAGKVAGVQITPGDGRPGSGSRIRIRGGASLNASNDPLIVVDGVPLSSGAGDGNGLNLINPNDIETFTILKDPSAAAIYGSRASNGVIIITTKKGKKGNLKVNFNSQAFIQTTPKRFEVLSSDQVRQVVSQNAPDMANLLGKSSTDWQDQIFRTAFAHDYNVGLSGAIMNGKLPFRLSGGYINQDGLIKTDKFERLSGALNLSPSFFNNKLKVDVTLKIAQRNARIAPNVVGGATGFDPTQTVLSGNNNLGGYWEWLDNAGRPKNIAPRNPVAEIYLTNNNLKALRSIGNIQVDYQIPFVKGLRINGSLGYDYSNERGLETRSDSLAGFFIDKGRYSPYYGENKSTVYDIYLNYSKDLKSIKSRIDFMAGHGRQNFNFYRFNHPGRRLNGEILPGSEPVFLNNGNPGYKLISYYSRLNYSYAGKYIITLNARTDGSSKFYSGGRWGFFPGGAFAWRINEESFLKNSNIVSDLKLRVGYGITGQQDGIANYGYIPNYAVSTNTALYQLGNQFISMVRPGAYDEKLRWETTTNINAAIDFGFFDNRLSGTLEGFIRKTKDLLSEVPVPAGANFSNRLLTNVGSIESKGFEITINTIPVRNKNVEWNFGVNFTYANPIITNLLLNPDPNFKGVATGDIGGGATIGVHQVGQRPSSFFVLKQIYDRSERPIEGLYEDFNRDGRVSDDERYLYKNPEARYFFGVNSSVNFKKLSAGFVMRGSIGNYVYNRVASETGVLTAFFNRALGFLGNGSADYLNTGFSQRQLFSDYYIQNASFLRMDNINIGYDAGEVMKNVRLRITGNVQNAFVITKYKGLDPEVAGGIDGNVYPRARIFVFGVNLDF
jgi:TonB-dependent starch-binding outer membrane protein SusC